MVLLDIFIQMFFHPLIHHTVSIYIDTSPGLQSSIYLPIHSFILPSILPSIHPSIHDYQTKHLFTYLPIYISCIHLPPINSFFHPSIYPSINLFIHLPIYPAQLSGTLPLINPSIYPCIHSSIPPMYSFIRPSVRPSNHPSSTLVEFSCFLLVFIAHCYSDLFSFTPRTISFSSQ